MKVRARWNVKDASGWHAVGEVFETEADLGSAVEVLEEAKPEAKPEKPEEPEAPKEKAAEKPKTTRRKKAEKAAE